MAEKITPERRAIGQKLKDARDALHLDQADIAERVAASDRTVSRWERGASLPTSKGRLAEIEEAYQLTRGSLSATPAHGAVSRETHRSAPKPFGRNVLHYRGRKRLSADALARKLKVQNLDGDAIEELEAGKSTAQMRATLLPKLARALGVAEAALLADPAADRALEGVPSPESRAADTLWSILQDIRRMATRVEEAHRDLLRRAAHPDDALESSGARR